MISLGEIYIQPKAALIFAVGYDQLNAHVTGQPNMILPANTISGLYIVSLALWRLFEEPSYVLRQCATSLSVQWKRPVQENDIVTANYSFTETLDTERTPAFIKRSTRVSLWVSKTLVASIQIANLFPPTI